MCSPNVPFQTSVVVSYCPALVPCSSLNNFLSLILTFLFRVANPGFLDPQNLMFQKPNTTQSKNKSTLGDLVHD
jgi:hypothetical protein